MDDTLLNGGRALLVLLAASVLGCSSDTGGSRSDEAPSPEPALRAREDKHDLRLVISEEEQAITENLSPALIEARVRAIDWNDRETYPIVWIQRGGQHYSLWIAGWLNTNDPEDALRAGWNGASRTTGAGRTNNSRPLKSVDGAIALLVSYFNDDDQWKTTVEWEYDWDSL